MAFGKLYTYKVGQAMLFYEQSLLLSLFLTLTFRLPAKFWLSPCLAVVIC